MRYLDRAFFTNFCGDDCRYIALRDSSASLALKGEIALAILGGGYFLLGSCTLRAAVALELCAHSAFLSQEGHSKGTALAVLDPACCAAPAQQLHGCKQAQLQQSR